MVDKLLYTDLTTTLKYLKIQVIDSIPFAAENCPNFRNNPKGLFYWLKGWLRYQDDPKGVELLQTMQTLWNNGGLGDCDCFVITTIACLLVNDFKDINVVLVGRNRRNAVHIYTQVIQDGKPYILDLTNTYFDHERNSYNYKQVLPFKFSINQKK